MDKYKIIKTIGKGAGGRVVLAADENGRYTSVTLNLLPPLDNAQHHTANSPFLLPHITYIRDGENFLIYQRNSHDFFDLEGVDITEKFDADHYWSSQCDHIKLRTQSPGKNYLDVFTTSHQ